MVTNPKEAQLMFRKWSEYCSVTSRKRSNIVVVLCLVSSFFYLVVLCHLRLSCVRLYWVSRSHFRYFTLSYVIFCWCYFPYVHLTFSYVALRYVTLRSVNIFVTLRHLTLSFVNVLFLAWSATSWCRWMYGPVQPFGQTPHIWGSLHTSGQKWQVRR